MTSISTSNSLFDIDAELDDLLDEIQGQIEAQGEPSEDQLARFREFCAVHGEKVDRIGRFIRMMEAREQYCRSEPALVIGLGPRQTRLSARSSECPGLPDIGGSTAIRKSAPKVS
jgi:hypothetical protein